MTFENCQSAVVGLRGKQVTRCPLVRVDYGGTVFRGRLARADSDPEIRRRSGSLFGVLVLEGLGDREPETVLQIANIPENGINTLDA